MRSATPSGLLDCCTRNDAAHVARAAIVLTLATLPPFQGRRLDLNQHDAVYKTAASLFGHVGFSQAGARGFEPRSHGFGGRFLSQEDTPVIGLRP